MLNSVMLHWCSFCFFHVSQYLWQWVISWTHKNVFHCQNYTHSCKCIQFEWFWTVKEFPSRKYDVIWINLFLFQTRRWWRKHACELDIFESHGSGTKNELLRKGLGFQLQFIRRFHEKGKSRIHEKYLLLETGEIEQIITEFFQSICIILF